MSAETYPQYLRRVGRDYKASGYEATAEDYMEAAKRLAAADKALAFVAHASTDPDVTALAEKTLAMLREGA